MPTGTPTAPVSVAIIDDNPVFVQGLASVLRDDGLQCMHFGGGMRGAPVSECNVALIGLQNADALGRLDDLRRVDTCNVIIGLVDTPEPGAFLAALRCGCSSAIWRGSDPADFPVAIRLAHRGRASLPLNVLDRLVTSLPVATVPDLAAEDLLSLKELSRGSSVRDIAHKLGYSERATHRRLANTYRRLGVNNRSEAIALAAQSGLLVE